MPSISSHDAWFAGLKALGHDSFPKRCRNCGRVFASEADYFQQTQAIRPEITGLKAAYDDDDRPLVEVFRNCVCGSTLLVNCVSRRDDSAAGNNRRQLFDTLLDYLTQHGVERAQARGELLRVASGERSEVLEAWYGQIAAQGRRPEA
ncbi:hypothetical protein P8H27_10785 [Pseudomonas sp. sp1636]|uniref:hypothetical protein n=1 Tax=Pseudomonas sp. sp1636 TaxID=3036707 RepID=UPI0025A5F030|nr:hypothetical protein [Pseudomonas sp. sp1636]MDM8349385.1 hypothetical protein [Pseudomonas sp. sp1636]